VDTICSGFLDDGFKALVEHNDLIRHRIVHDENGRTSIAQSN
jgi:hypothetical protein